MDYQFTKPIEMPRGTHYGNNYWVFHSRKLNRRVTAFSNLEYENLLTLEMNSGVVYYCEQPCQQTVRVDGQKYDTVFDAYVVYGNGKEELQEVKYEEELKSNSKQGERSRHQIEVQKYWCLQNDFPYTVRTDRYIEIGSFTIRNLSILCAKARRYSNSDNISDESFVQFLSERGKISIGQLYSSGRITSQRGLDYLADLFYRGIIRFDDLNEAPITNNTGVMLYGM